MHEPKPAFLMHIFLYKMQSQSASGRAGRGVGAGRVGFQRQGFRPPTTGRAPTFSAKSYGTKSSGDPHPFLPHPANSFKLNLRAYTASGGSLTSSVSNQAAEPRRLPSVASGMAAMSMAQEKQARMGNADDKGNPLHLPSLQVGAPFFDLEQKGTWQNTDIPWLPSLWWWWWPSLQWIVLS